MASPFSDDEMWSDDDFADSGDESYVDKHTEKAPQEDSKPKISKHILQLQQRLGLDVLKEKKEAIKASGASSQGNSKAGPLVVVYSDPSKRKKERDLKKQQEQQQLKPKSGKKALPPKDEQPEFNIIKAKHEVKQLTIKSLKKASKQEAQAALAISLGALPPKRKAVNYKELKETKKKELEQVKKLKEAEHIFAGRVGTMTKRKQPKKDRNKVAKFDADFGKLAPGLRKQLTRANKSNKR